jgi:thymidylate synthase (FAD)
MKPIKAKDLLELDRYMKVVMLRQTQLPQTLVYQAGKNDYSEDPIHTKFPPSEKDCGKWVIEQLLANERGHWGPLEHPAITLDCVGFVHNVIVQARTHRIGCCLSGDTNVYFTHSSLSNGEVYYSKTIKELADLWFNGRTHQRTQADADYMKSQINSRQLMHLNEDTLQLQPTNITNIYENGEKEVWEVTIQDGDNTMSIKSTMDHKFFTPSGWKQLKELSVDDEVYVVSHKSNSIERNIPPFSDDEIKNEVWRRIKKYPDYEVSNLGNVRSWAPKKHRGKLVQKKTPTKKTLCGNGKTNYLYVSLRNPNKEVGVSDRINVHTLVLESFEKEQDHHLVARHLDGNSYNNKITNLRWGTQDENAKDRVTHKVTYKKQGSAGVITQIKYIGVEMTYDLEVKGPHHNFIANGIVVHNSFDVQSQRYTGRRVLKVANGDLKPEEVFYVRPEGLYLDRKGHKYEWTKDDYERQLKFCLAASERYAEGYEKRGMAEEHLRDYLPQNIRQNFVVSFSLRAALHFLDLRAKLDAQVEIQGLCEAMVPVMKEWVPEIFSYYEERRLHKARLAP